MTTDTIARTPESAHHAIESSPATTNTRMTLHQAIEAELARQDRDPAPRPHRTAFLVATFNAWLRQNGSDE